jgi:DNA polymerase III epsilon subunit-like protein
MKKELYISVDVETSGPIPGKYSMLSLGAVPVDRVSETFYVELKPISKEFVPDALKVSHFDLAKLELTGIEPNEAMLSFQRWIAKVSGNSKPIFVGFNACFDWQFVNWYFETFAAKNPFGFSGIDIKSYYMGFSGVPWSETTSSQLPHKFQSDTRQNHNALDDALAQASIFRKLIEAKRN